MSLTASLLIGRSALAASQIAIRTAGDNIANAASPGYTRRVATLAPARGEVSGNNLYFGRGVEVESINRQIDVALEARVRTSVSDQESAVIHQRFLAQVESITADQEDTGLSAELREFLSSFNEIANHPSSTVARSLAVETGRTLGQYLQRLRGDLVDVRAQIDGQIGANVTRADELLGEVGALNEAIVVSEQGRTENAALRDQRDALLKELSTYLDISVLEQPSGAVDVYVGSTPIVLGATSRGLKTLTRVENGEERLYVATIDREEKLAVTSGRLGGLLEQREGDLQRTIDDLDALATGLIFEVNRLHAQGRPLSGLTSTTSERTVAPADQSLAFNDGANTTFASLPFAPENGSFVVVVRNSATGQTQRTTIGVDLDGVDASGGAGFADDTSLSSLVADLSGVANLTVSAAASGRVTITADSGFEFSFEDDTSGALAALGLNTFFTGEDAADIGVRQELADNPLLVVAGVQEGSNEAALAIAALADAGVASLDGVSLTDHWRRTTERIAVATRASGTRAQAAGDVRAALEAQRAAISGVSIDEETLNLLTYQRQYQAAAQFISVVDELTQILLGLV